MCADGLIYVYVRVLLLLSLVLLGAFFFCDFEVWVLKFLFFRIFEFEDFDLGRFEWGSSNFD